MENAIQTYCPKCNASFTCRLGDVVNCQCYSVPLSQHTRDALAKTSMDCLCKNCLDKAESDSGIARQRSLKRSKPVLIENLDYYMEGEYCVFTEFYHRQRGYCCKNGCRHCPYEKEPKL